MILILTGGIGSGKSLAAGMLNEMYGFPVYSADMRVKELYSERPELLDKIEGELGCRVRDDKGNFVPSLLAGLIFSDGDALEKVENIVFHVLKDDFENWTKDNPSAVHILESATILEKDFFRGFGDLALVVTAPLEVRIKRAMERDSSTEDQIRSRVEKQKMMNDLGLLEACCWLPFEVCQNDASPEELRSKLANFIENKALTKMLY